eukprot:1195527-Prorocentrum_minimum.AAC.4
MGCCMYLGLSACMRRRKAAYASRWRPLSAARSTSAGTVASSWTNVRSSWASSTPIAALVVSAETLACDRLGDVRGVLGDVRG